MKHACHKAEIKDKFHRLDNVATRRVEFQNVARARVIFCELGKVRYR